MEGSRVFVSIKKSNGRKEGREAEIGVVFMHRAFLDALIILRIILHYHTLNVSEIKEVRSQRHLVNMESLSILFIYRIVLRKIICSTMSIN